MIPNSNTSTRRGFLGSGLAVTSKALVGSYILSNANLLVPERSLHIQPDPNEIVISTDIPPEPLGHVTLQVGRVEVRRNTIAYQDFGYRQYGLSEPMTYVTIQGAVLNDEFQREEGFFEESRQGNPIRIYFAKVN